jgi:hypothetical protein
MRDIKRVHTYYNNEDFKKLNLPLYFHNNKKYKYKKITYLSLSG